MLLLMREAEPDKRLDTVQFRGRQRCEQFLDVSVDVMPVVGDPRASGTAQKAALRTRMARAQRLVV